MNSKFLTTWFSTLAAIGVVFGIVYSFFGLDVFPVFENVGTGWGNGVYGSTLIGFCVLLFFAGRHAFQNNDIGLMKALLYGLFSWLVIEALFSIYYKVFLNVGVDVLLMLFLGFPLFKRIKQIKQQAA